MTASTQSLWSEQIVAQTQTPTMILHGQAEALTKQTQSVLVGEIVMRRQQQDTETSFRILALDIRVPALNDYRHRLLMLVHEEDMPYPVALRLSGHLPSNLAYLLSPTIELVDEFGPHGEIPNPDLAENDKQLIKLLQHALTSSKVISIAQSLIARANEAQLPENSILKQSDANGADHDDESDQP